MNTCDPTLPPIPATGCDGKPLPKENPTATERKASNLSTFMGNPRQRVKQERRKAEEQREYDARHNRRIQACAWALDKTPQELVDILNNPSIPVEDFTDGKGGTKRTKLSSTDREGVRAALEQMAIDAAQVINQQDQPVKPINPEDDCC